MDAITQRGREEKTIRGGKREGNGEAVRERERENERREINWRLACVFGRQKISLIPCSSFPLWICQWRGFLVKSSCDGFLTRTR